MKVTLVDSPTSTKKFRVIFPDGKHVDFGSRGASDYTINKNQERKNNYLARHGASGQDWSSLGIRTAGVWSRWLLWNKTSISEAKQFLTSRFEIVFSSGQAK